MAVIYKEAHNRAVKKYDAINTRRFGIKLNRNTDGDLIEFLEQSGNFLGTVKAALREYIANHPEYVVNDNTVNDEQE